MIDQAIIEALNHRTRMVSAATSTAPGPQIGWVQLREKGPMHRLFKTATNRHYFWSVVAARFIPIAADRLPEIVQL